MVTHQLTASRTDLNLKILKFCMCLCPLHTTALVKIQMLAANLARSQFSSSSSFFVFFFPSSNSVHHCNGIRELRFCLDCVVQIEVLHEKRLELFHDAFSRELGPRTLFCVCTKSSFLSSHSSVLIGGTLYICPPTTGPRNKCQTHPFLTRD